MPAQEELLPGYRLQRILPHPSDVFMAGQAECDPIHLAEGTTEINRMGGVGFEFGRISPMTVRALDPPVGVDPLHEVGPHLGVTHHTGIALIEVPSRAILSPHPAGKQQRRESSPIKCFSPSAYPPFDPAG